VTDQNHHIPVLNKISRFFHIKKAKYIFVVLDDERMLNHILEQVILGQGKKGRVIHHFLLSETDYSAYRQVMNFTNDKVIDGLIVTGLNQLIDKYGGLCIDTLNKARDAFENIGLPIVWIIDKISLEKIIRDASDFYQMRHLPDFHIASTIKDTKTLFDINFFYNPYPGDKETDPGFLEKQLEKLLPRARYGKEAINGLIIPLLRIYLDRDNIDGMNWLYDTYLKDREEKVHDKYILVAYYTAVGRLAGSPLFPQHFFQPSIPRREKLRLEPGLQRELIKAVNEKKGTVVLLGKDEPGKSALISCALENLDQKGFDFIIIYGETVPELILLNAALKAKEKGDKNAVKIFSGKQSVEEKLDYFIEHLFYRHKIAVIFNYFEENQWDMPGGGCKSPRLKEFLQRTCERLKGKDSFLLISTCVPITGYFTLETRGESTAGLTLQRIDRLSAKERETLEVLSLYRSPVQSTALSFHNLYPDDIGTLRNLEELSLVNFIDFIDKENRAETRLYVPRSVSPMIKKRLDNETIKKYHSRAGEYFEKYRQDKDTSYIENTIEARHHFIEAEEWNKAAELTLKLFAILHAQNYVQWAFDLLNELEMEKLDVKLIYQVRRRLGLLHYYKGSYAYSWHHYEKALELIKKPGEIEDRRRLYSEILPVEMAVNRDLIPGNISVFKGISHSISIPSIEIINIGPKAILNYFNEIEKDTVDLLECKLIILGSGGVGKTTLMKKLKDPSFQAEPGEEVTTHGIDIVPWELTCTFADGETHNVKIRFWDFGGQEIYHSVHQLFLTKRSLYLFVWEARKEDTHRDFEYWLNVIKLLSNSSPVIMVMNKADLRIKSIDEVSLKEKYENITGFNQVSCLTGQGIEELTEQIRASIGSMPHLRDRLPAVWKQIRDYLEKIKKNYINLSDYFNICGNYGLKEEQAEFLGDYLHDLGVILHYRHDKLLKDTVILNLEWAVETIYTLVDTREIQENNGRFKFDDLRRYWDLTKFPREKHAQLLRLMEKFGLCFPIMGTESYIVPELLPAKRPDFDFGKYKEAGNLHFQYHYDFMPEGIIFRFISRMYYLIKDDHSWKNGVELRFEDSTALVLSELLNRKMKISVTGTFKNDLLAIIRNDFAYVHQTLNMEKNRNYFEMIPCNCPQCLEAENPQLYKFDMLKKFMDKGIQSIHCFNSTEEVSIKKLLKGFETLKPRKGLLDTLISTASKLQGVSKTIKPYEDSRNSFFSRLLSTQGFMVKYQPLWGSSVSGKAMGNVDLKVESINGEAVSIIEAFSLKSFNKNIIKSHLHRFFSYDPGDMENNYLLVYAEAEDFPGLWKKYFEFLAEIDYPYKLIGTPEELQTSYANIKLARTRHHREGGETIIYHIFINMI
jgi:internalin A